MAHLQERITEVLTYLRGEGIELTQDGNDNAKQPQDPPGLPINHIAVARAMEAIPDVFQSTTNWELNSYGGKHALEETYQGDKYVSNGTFIMAMILSGYSYEFCQTKLNATFKAKAKPQ